MIPFGSLMFAASTLFFTVEHRALWEAFVASGMAGIGIGFTFAAMPGFIVRAVPRSETGSAMGLYQVLRSIGLSLGSALAAAVLITYTAPGDTYPLYQGFRFTLIIATALCVLTAVLSYLLPGKSNGGLSTPPGDLDKMMEDEAEVGGVGLMLADDPLGSEPTGSGA
jgi:MFS family permease